MDLISSPRMAIAEQVEFCIEAFQSIPEVEETNKNVSVPVQIQDQFGRFKIWSSNIGAHRSGRSSLDYRLRDASHLKTRVLELLEDLGTAVQDIVAILRGDKVPWDELPSDSEESDDESDFDPRISVDEQEMHGDEVASTELGQILSSVEDIITDLLRLSQAMKSPAPHERFLKAVCTDTSHFFSFDRSHVANKFPKAEPFLLDKLSRAISKRRQYFKYREQHHIKLAQGFSTEQKDETSTIASSLPSRFKATETPDIELDQFVDTGSESGLSETSYQGSEGNTERPHIPSLASRYTDGKPFPCPFYFLIISVTSSHSWKKHVLNDLRPYVCLYKDCLAPENTFARRRDWIAHDVQNHRKEWLCALGCSESITSRRSLEQHIHDIHPEMASNEQTDALMRAGEKPLSPTARVICPLCKDPNEGLLSHKEYQSHVGRHQQELAIFSLPTLPENYADDDDGPGDDSEHEASSVDSDILSFSDNHIVSNQDEQHDSVNDLHEGMVIAPGEGDKLEDGPPIDLGVPSHHTTMISEEENEAKENGTPKGQVDELLPGLEQGKMPHDKMTTKEDAKKIVEAREAQEEKIKEPKVATEKATFDSDNPLFQAPPFDTTNSPPPSDTTAAPPILPAGATEQLKEDSDVKAIEEPLLAQEKPEMERIKAKEKAIADAGWEANELSKRVVENTKTIEEILERDKRGLEETTAKLKAEEAQLDILKEQAKMAAEADERHEKLIEEAKTAAVELEAARTKPENEAVTSGSSDDMLKPPVKFKDAVGRKFSFPWHLCKTWKGMEALINQAFLHVDVIGQHVLDGHYDLIGPDGNIILPQVYESMVKPGWSITMHMWPMPEPPNAPKSPGGIPPPPNALKRPSGIPPPPPPPLPLPPDMMVAPSTTLPRKKEKKKSKSNMLSMWIAGGPSKPIKARKKT